MVTLIVAIGVGTAPAPARSLKQAGQASSAIPLGNSRWQTEHLFTSFTIQIFPPFFSKPFRSETRSHLQMAAERGGVRRTSRSMLKHPMNK
jgi:hypothetical protein